MDINSKKGILTARNGS